MRMELRVCKPCYEGTHGNLEKTAVTRDLVALAEQVREYKDLIGFNSLYITRVTEGDPGGEETLPVVVASIENDQIWLTDTQLTLEDDQQKLVYPYPKDILGVLTRNLDQIEEQTRQDVTVELSSESSALLTE